MRTSRISRDTARLLDALPAMQSSPRRRRLPAAPLAVTIRASNPAVKLEAQDRPNDPADDYASSSPLSSAPSDFEPDFEDASDETTSPPSIPSPNLKRKRPTASKSFPSLPTPRQRNAPKATTRRPATQPGAGDQIAPEKPPANWEETYRLTREMRAQWAAPVDTMGCESLAEERRSPRDRRLQTLVALMLSSQTKDTVTAVAMRNLQEGLVGGFTLEAILEVEPEVLNGLIEKVGFHNNKTRFIKATAVILRDQHASDIPSTIEGLVALPGVGPKMAYLCMSAAWGRDEGIGVDVHVHRITNLWGWHKTKSPEETRARLESWLPKDRWHDINNLLVGFGQTWCPPVGRRCGECRLARGLCPSAVLGRTVKKVKREGGLLKKELQGVEVENVKVEDEGQATVKLDDGAEVKVEVEVEPVNEADLVPAHAGLLPDIEDLGRRPRASRQTAR